MLASLFARTAAGSPWDDAVWILVLFSWVAAFFAVYVGMLRMMQMGMRMGIPAFFRRAGGPILALIALIVASITLSAGWIIACVPLAIAIYRKVALRMGIPASVQRRADRDRLYQHAASRRTDPEGGSGPS